MAATDDMETLVTWYEARFSREGTKISMHEDYLVG